MRSVAKDLILPSDAAAREIDIVIEIGNRFDAGATNHFTYYIVNRTGHYLFWLQGNDPPVQMLLNEFGPAQTVLHLSMSFF